MNARGTIAQWAGLAGASLVLVWALERVHVPAALLLGPMLVGIVFGTRGSSVRVPRAAFLFAQGIVGCLIARSITADIVASVLRDWPAMLLVVLSTIVAGAVVAWLLGRYGSLPGSSAAWGSSPGGASAMVAMAEEFGADPRIVAFMQYARVVCVVLTAALVARVVNGPGGEAAAPVGEARPASLLGDAVPILATLALAVGGGWLGRVLRVPAGGLLGPMLLGAGLHAGGLLDITIPEPLLALSYAGIGWYVGLRFTKPLLASLWRAVPQIVGASFVLIALGGVSAGLLIRLRHTDPLTAFLATTPGGIDSVAIIAVGTPVDVGFVMALQTLRVLVVILTGAPLARFIARTSRRPEAPAAGVDRWRRAKRRPLGRRPNRRAIRVSSRLSAGSPAPARRASPLDHPVLPVALAVGSVVALALAMPAGAVLRDLALPDNDDAMRLVQVLDLVRGQGWFDKVQHRYGPPAGALTHWSRLVDLPLAGGIGLLSPLLGERLAAGLVAAAWPLCLLVLYAALIGRTALAWYGRRTAWLSIVAITQLATIGLFAPGRIDHHGLQALAVAGFLVALATPAGEARRAGRLGAVAGLLAALSLAIGLETAPFVALAGLAATLAWSADLPGSRPRLVAFGAALALGAPLLFASETLPSAWLRPSCDALSSPWLALAILGGAGAAGLGLASGRIRGPAGRLAGAALVGAAALGAFAAIAPHCLRGPFADLPAIVRREWLARVLEALPIGDAIRISPDAVLGGILPLALATLLMARRAATASGETRARDALLAATFGLGALIATVQMRGIYVASCLLPLAAASALDRAATRVAARGAVGPALAAVAVALLLFGKVASLPALLLPAGPAAAAGRAGPGCADGRTLAALDRMEPGLVLAPIELGTSILLFTRHAILAAPYHRETAGLAAALEGFGGGEADLKAAVARTGATIVALCTGWDSARHGMGAPPRGRRGPGLARAGPPGGDLLAWRVRPLP